jgi:FAD/FMN-containing dehydrogenase
MSTTLPSTPSTELDPVAELRKVIVGPVIAPDDPDHDRATPLFYGGLDRRPAAIVRPTGSRDVARAILVAADLGVELAVRSGGHGMLGHATVDDGIVLDLGGLRGLDLDVTRRVARVQPGVTAGEYTQVAAAHGLATGFGDAGSVGLGGLTVGGGIGLLARKHGLTIDNLLAAEVVTADGRIRPLDERSEPDLFWAVRGGAGNVGVVTRLDLRLHEVPSIVGGYLVLPATADVITGFVELADAAPDELSTIANVMSAAPPLPFIPAEAHGQRVLFAMMVYAGETEAGEAAIGPFRRLATPLADLLGPKRYVDMFPPEDEDGFHPLAVGETVFRDTFDGDAAQLVLDALEASTAIMGAVQLRVLGGAVSRVANQATAYAHRDRRIMINTAAMFGDPSERAVHRAWVERYATALGQAPLGRYVNFLGDDSEAAARAAYPHGAYERLAAIKQRYDPANLFRNTVNVPPTSG